MTEAPRRKKAMGDSSNPPVNQPPVTVMRKGSLKKVSVGKAYTARPLGVAISTMTKQERTGLKTAIGHHRTARIEGYHPSRTQNAAGRKRDVPSRLRMARGAGGNQARMDYPRSMPEFQPNGAQRDSYTRVSRTMFNNKVSPNVKKSYPEPATELDMGNFILKNKNRTIDGKFR